MRKRVFPIIGAILVMLIGLSFEIQAQKKKKGKKSAPKLTVDECKTLQKKGDAAKKSGKYSRAIKCYKKIYRRAVSVDDRVSAGMKTASCYIAKKKYDQAVKVYELIKKLDKASPEAKWDVDLAWGDLEILRNNPSEAVSIFNGMLKSDAMSNQYRFKTLIALGRAFMAQENYTVAEKKFYGASKLGGLPNSSVCSARIWRGDCLTKLKKFEAAELHIDESLAMRDIGDYNLSRGMLSLGDCLHAQERWEEAIKQYKELIAFKKAALEHKKKVIMRLGETYRAMDDYGAAIDYYEKIVKTSKDDNQVVEAYIAIAQMHRKDEEYQDALKILKKAQLINCDDKFQHFSVGYNLGETFVELGNKKDAIRAFKGLVGNSRAPAKLVKKAQEQLKKLQ